MPKTVPLKYPVTVDGHAYAELVMRRATKRDDLNVRRAKGDPADQEIRMFANLCEIAPDVVEELDLGDYLAIQTAFKEMFADTSGVFELHEHGERMKLGHPVMHAGALCAELAMRRPKVREEKAARRGSASPAEQEVKLFAVLCDVPSALIESLDLGDHGVLQDGYAGFFPAAAAPA